MHFFKKIHLFSNQIRTVMLAGGGDTAYYLSDLLQKSGISVKLIEKNRERCEELAGLLPGVTVIHGNAEKKEILLEEGLENTGAFVALTNLDEENILLSLYAKSRMNGKLVTKINHPEYEEIIRKLELDSIVNSENITAESIVRFVRAMKSSVGSNVETLYTLIKGRVEAAEFLIRSQSSIVGVPLQELHFRENILIAAIFRGGKMILPRGQDTIQIGDSVIVVSRNLGLHDICDILV
ncbi:MAG: NAD-binding protein [Ruminococcus sp.]